MKLRRARTLGLERKRGKEIEVVFFFKRNKNKATLLKQGEREREIN